jgi:hypothetical protein
MTRRLIAVALLPLTALLCWWQWTPHAVITAAPPVRAVPIDHGAIVRVEIVYEDGFVQIVYPGLGLDTPTPPSQTPTDTHTPTPSRTPSVTPLLWPTWTATNTPGWSPTPEDVHTPSPTPPPTASPTLTPTYPPTLSPTPTATATPGGVCRATVIASSTLNVRSNPSTDGMKLGTLAGGTVVQVYMIHAVTNEGDPDRTEWGMIAYTDASGFTRTAWIALWYKGAELARLDDSAPCWELPIEYEAEMAQQCPGWHSVLPQVDLPDMQLSFIEWVQKGVCVAAKGVEETHAPAMALGFGGIGVQRLKRGPQQGGDCTNPQLFATPEDAARDMWDRTWPAALTMAPPEQGWWLEMDDNECDFIYWSDLPWLDRYFAKEIELASAAYPGRVIFGSMLAGAWTQDRVNALRSTWDAALETGACLGLHAGSPFDDLAPLDALNISWAWPYSFNHRDIRRWLVELDPRYVAIPFCVTEFYTGGWMPYNPPNYYAWWQETRRDGIRLSTVFTAGLWPGPSVNGKMAVTAALWPPLR